MKGFDTGSLRQCPRHGYHAGAVCPVCFAEGDGSAAAVPAAETATGTPETAPAPDTSRENWWKGPEKDLHDLFAAECLRRGVEFIRCRTDAKSTIEEGWPDFTTLFCGSDGVTRACLIEFKNRVGRTSKVQDEVIARLRRCGIPVLVTGDFAEAVDFLKANILK
jgi:hypothetical protein